MRESINMGEFTGMFDHSNGNLCLDGEKFSIIINVHSGTFVVTKQHESLYKTSGPFILDGFQFSIHSCNFPGMLFLGTIFASYSNGCEGYAIYIRGNDKDMDSFAVVKPTSLPFKTFLSALIEVFTRLNGISRSDSEILRKYIFGINYGNTPSKGCRITKNMRFILV